MDGIPKRSGIALVVIDMQEKFRPAIHQFPRVVENCSKLIHAFKLFGIPIVHTEQYPQGIGPTVAELADILGGGAEKPIEKLEFSCMRNKEFKDRLKALGAETLVICGVEAHVCVLQTALDAARIGLEVYLVEDAVSSRKESDWKTALTRAPQSGVYSVSTEMLIFQLLDKAGTEEFKAVQKIVK